MIDHPRNGNCKCEKPEPVHAATWQFLVWLAHSTLHHSGGKCSNQRSCRHHHDLRLVRPTIMKLFALASFALVVAGLVAAAEPPKQLRIGVKKRVPAAECAIKTVAGDRVEMEYTGKLWEGEQFDTSVGRGPFEFVLGQGQVVRLFLSVPPGSIGAILGVGG